MKRAGILLIISLLLMVPDCGFATLLNLGAEELVQAGDSPISVSGYSVPSYVDWDNDGRSDLVIGEGGAGFEGKVRVYLNNGTASNPQFSDFFYAQSDGSDLIYWDGSCNCGCLGLFPRVVDWDEDGRKDLVTGTLEGTVELYLNVNTDAEPAFDGGTLLDVGAPGAEMPIDIGARACPTVVDWDNDGKKDLVVGALDGKIHIFLNEGTDAAPDFLIETVASENGSDLVVLSSRSSPVIMDLDGDGNKDLLTGNTNGQLLLYSNVGTDAAPLFLGYVLVESDGAAIDLADWPRSRPFVCDWTGDGYLDVLVGSGDGMVHLYEGIPEPATLLVLGLGTLALLRRRSR
ncbi:MAG: FG-GAP repeat domain-containing protein [Planctomycetota bacterium]